MNGDGAKNRAETQSGDKAAVEGETILPFQLCFPS